MSGSDDLPGDLVAKARQGARGETGALELLEKGERMFHMKRNKKTVAILTVGLLTVAGGAYAYWTSTGTGTGAPRQRRRTTATSVHPGQRADNHGARRRCGRDHVQRQEQQRPQSAHVT